GELAKIGLPNAGRTCKHEQPRGLPAVCVHTGNNLDIEQPLDELMHSMILAVHATEQPLPERSQSAGELAQSGRCRLVASPLGQRRSAAVVFSRRSAVAIDVAQENEDG